MIVYMYIASMMEPILALRTPYYYGLIPRPIIVSLILTTGKSPAEKKYRCVTENTPNL